MTEAWPTGTLIAGKFRVVRVLGTGGMGVVYEVIHEITRHRRALKTLNAKSREQPSAVERFLREASAAGRIASPHITETFDAGVLDSGEPYLVMELLEGETLEARMQRKRRLGFEEIIAIFSQAAEGIQAAHDAGIIHRDLKPENIFLTKTRAGMGVKILDFGVSIFDERHRLDRSTQDGTILGTPYYMSPEQVRGERQLDGRSDVYALGIMLHECANGVHPYPAETVPAIIANVIEKRPAPLVDLVPGISPLLSAVCARAIEKDPEGRTPSARAFAEGLAECARELGGEITGTPPSASTPPPKSAVSWISAPPPPVSIAEAPISLANAASVAPPPVASVSMKAAEDRDADGRAPRRAPLALSLVGGLGGAAIVAVGLYFVLIRVAPPAHRTSDAATTAASVSADVAPPAAGTTTPDVMVAPAPSAAASAAAVAASSEPSATASGSLPPVGRPAPSGAKARTGKPGDLAGKGEFKP